MGVKDGAAWVLAEGADGAMLSRSVPIDKMLDDAMVAYAQNGEAIRPENGYPMRLILPGWEGNINVKWLRRLKIGDKPFMTREETSKYTDLITLTGKARQFTWVMEAKSLITFPSGDMQLPGKGFYEISGIAWSGRAPIERVEITTDGGKTWSLASLQEPVLPKAHVRFRYPWHWDGSESDHRKPRHRPDRLCPAHQVVPDPQRRRGPDLSLQWHPELEGRRRREREQCPQRLSKSCWARRCWRRCR